MQDQDRGQTLEIAKGDEAYVACDGDQAKCNHRFHVEGRENEQRRDIANKLHQSSFICPLVGVDEIDRALFVYVRSEISNTRSSFCLSFGRWVIR